jgi:hypothetical protein
VTASAGKVNRAATQFTTSAPIRLAGVLLDSGT